MLLSHRLAVNLDELREVATVGKRRGDCRDVGSEAVRGDLEALRRSSGPKALDEGVRGPLVPVPKGEVQNELALSVNCDEAIGIADAVVVRFPRVLWASFFCT